MTLKDIDLRYQKGSLTSSKNLAIGGSPSAVTEALELVSDTVTQRRLMTTSYFETDSSGSAETIRLHFGNAAGKTGSSAKNAIAWFADGVSTTTSQVWVQAHDYLYWYNTATFAPAAVNTTTDQITVTAHGLPTSPGWKVSFSSTGTVPGGLVAATAYYAKRIDANTLEIYTDAGLTSKVDLTSQGTGAHTITPDNEFNNNHHRHFSIEVSNSDLSNKNTRFSIPWGFDTTEIGFFQANVNVNGGGRLRVNSSAGAYAELQLNNTLSDNLAPDGTNFRWSVQKENTAETGSNVGSDFRIVRFNDAGSVLDAPLYIKRSTGAMGIGGVTAPAARVDALEAGSRHTFQATQSTSSSVNFAAYAAVLGLATNRVFDGRVTGDSVARLTVLGDGTHQWGSGSGAQDTNLYRSGANALATDDRFTAVGMVSSTDGTSAAATFSSSADGTATLGVVNINPFSTSKRAVDIRLGSDTVSRLRVDMSLGSSGTLTFGDGTTADVSLYRTSATTLRTNGSLTIDLDLRSTRNAQFGSNSLQVGGGTGVIGITNAGTAPTSNPTGGGVLYAEGGALKWRSPNGVVTTMAPA
jgi:hypothetical protein